MDTHAENLQDDPLLLRQDVGRIATLTLNRPEKFNALSEAMLDALQQALDSLREDDAIRVVVLAGAGKAFCGGHDLKEMRSKPDVDYYRHLFNKCSDMMLTMTQIPQPVVARVHGVATAAGCQLVANSDLAVASSGATFATSGITLGLFCSTPGVPLSRNILRKHAMELLLTGEFISAEAAADLGLLNRVVEPDRLDAEVYELAERIAAQPAVAVRTGKQLFYRQIDKQLEPAYRLAADVMAQNMMAPDTAEGIDAFIEKRSPAWKD